MNRRLLYSMIFIATLLLGIASLHAAERSAKTDTQTLLKQGEDMYRRGILPDGTPLKGYVRDIEIDSTVFSCENCHTRSGLGSTEGQVISPPVNYASLYAPRYALKDELKNRISKQKGVKRDAYQLRPAYTDETLGDAIRGGINPNLREFLPIMPRYDLTDADLEIMVGYLKNLSKTFSPGVTDSSLRFATIVTEEVPAEDRKALLASLETLANINRQYKTQRLDRRFFKMFRMLDNAFYKEITIDTWELKGKPETWGEQLKAYYEKNPVFAILGGISTKSWQPIHDFCESNKLPCLFPITDLQVISDNSWYTFYASKGYYQEGETAAKYLAEKFSSKAGAKFLQIVRDSDQGGALQKGFDTAADEKGLKNITTVKVNNNEEISPEFLAGLNLSAYQAIILWDNNSVVKVLNNNRSIFPDTVVTSYRYAGDSLLSLDEKMRDNVFITYPFRMPDKEKAFDNYSETFTLGKAPANDPNRVASRTFSMIHIFLLGLKETKLNYYRDTLIDVISMLQDQYLPDFVRYSFGPGQRYASKGCYIVKVASDKKKQFEQLSEWVLF